MKPRTIQQVLALPLTDEEQRIADKHIRRECARIRAGWSDDEAYWRSRSMPDDPRPRVVRGDDGRLQLPVQVPTWTGPPG